MQDKTCNIAAQYFRAVYATAHVRPYDNKSALTNAIEVELSREALPQPGHHRVELGVTVTGTNAEGIICFEAGAAVEGIVVETNLTDEELTQMLERNIPGLLLGNLRVAISNATSQTGYGPVTLPPITGEQLQALAQQSRGD
ncbi:preprotein translocase subunit SecB [compost metagenome]